MKSFVVFAMLVAAAMAAPASPDADAVIIKQDTDNIGVEGFKYGYETSNGIAQSEEGVLKNIGTENEALEVRGLFKYIKDGVTYLVTYIANEKGFQPRGVHLP